jgi:hypothetical protein
MIHQTKHNSKDYLMVYTDFIVEIGDEILKVPMVVQFNITDINPIKHYVIYQKVNYLFNRPIKLKKSPTILPTVNKPWYKFW